MTAKWVSIGWSTMSWRLCSPTGNRLRPLYRLNNGTEGIETDDNRFDHCCRNFDGTSPIRLAGAR
jgi:hypothetical protein